MTQKLISMSCPSCGGQADVALTGRQFTCRYCGAKWNVRPTSPNGGSRVPAGRLASEITIPRLEQEIDTLIISLLVEVEDRERLRAQLTAPMPRLILGEIVQVVGFILLTGALAWAIVGVGIAQTLTQPVPAFIVALVPLLAAACVIAGGVAWSGTERDRLYRIGQSKAQLRALYDQSRSRSTQFEQLLQDKREQLQRHKLLTSV